jgi:hypothetical protein
MCNVGARLRVGYVGNDDERLDDEGRKDLS